MQWKKFPPLPGPVSRLRHIREDPHEHEHSWQSAPRPLREAPSLEFALFTVLKPGKYAENINGYLKHGWNYHWTTGLKLMAFMLNIRIFTRLNPGDGDDPGARVSGSQLQPPFHKDEIFPE